MNITNCCIHVSTDKLEVHLSLHRSEKGSDGCALNAEAILQQLEKEGIVNGIDTEAVTQAVSFLSNNPDSPDSFLIAAAPGNPVVANVKLLFSETLKQYEQKDEDGTGCLQAFMQTPLVHSGTVLAEPFTGDNVWQPQDVYGNSLPGAEEVTGCRVVAGENVAYCKDTDTYKATVSGYPATERSLDNGLELVSISVIPLLKIAPDAMSARLSLRPSLPGTKPLNMEMLLAVLERERVVFGRLNRQLQKCLDTVTLIRQPAAVTAAMGVKPQDGVDAKLDYKVEVGPLPGKLRGDGSIDFRERRVFVGISEGDLIAVKIPPTMGKAGRNVHGDEVMQKPGKDFSIKVTDDAIFDSETGVIRAARSGVLSMVSENSVKVCAKQVVSGDVDFSTGNIITRGALEISGSIRPQFRVVALGDVLIGGNVEKASLRSDADIIIKGGIVGSRSRVQARGSVDIPFLEHGRVFARGNIVLRKSGYYCRLHSWENIYCSAESKIVASQIIASGSLTLGRVGTDRAHPAVVGAGIDPARLQLYYDYRRTRMSRQAEYDQLCQLHGIGSDNPTFLEARQELQAADEALRRLNLIPGTPPDEDPRNIVHLQKEVITVHGAIFKGAELRIGNVSRILERTMSSVRFFLSYEDESETANNPRPVIKESPLKGKK